MTIEELELSADRKIDLWIQREIKLSHKCFIENTSYNSMIYYSKEGGIRFMIKGFINENTLASIQCSASRKTSLNDLQDKIDDACKMIYEARRSVA